MAKVRKQFILEAAKIRQVRRILQVDTDTAAVEAALNLVIANAAIADGHRRIMGRCRLEDMDQSTQRG
ncbi:MAG: hypothetical protein HY696_06580 [Deltaproteobacteria bacterium]|nr:hypothetical protein [Deltaproteobacteria bacterium]